MRLTAVTSNGPGRAQATGAAPLKMELMQGKANPPEPTLRGLGIPVDNTNNTCSNSSTAAQSRSSGSKHNPELPHPAAQRCVPSPPHRPQQQILRVLDLYSGIGGMHHALLRVLMQSQRDTELSERGPEAVEREPSRIRGGPADQAVSDRLCDEDNFAALVRREGREQQQQQTPVDVTAVDINTLANRIYAAEFRVQPRALDLQRVTAAQLDELGADLWLLTPPCQPYTTTPNARRRDTGDPRAASLLHLMSTAGLRAMRRPPSWLLLENVPGFAGSDSHGVLQAALAEADYELQEFIVSPHQLGVPYSRPRYFALAVLRPLSLPRLYDSRTGPIEHPPDSDLGLTAGTSLRPVHPQRSAPDASADETCTTRTWPGVYDAGPDVKDKGPPGGPTAETEYGGGGAAAHPSSAVRYSLPPPCRATLEQFLTSTAPGSSAASPRTSLDVAAQGERSSSCGCDGDGGGEVTAGPVADAAGGSDPWVVYAVPVAQLARFWRVLDVVTPSSTYCNCFTKHYTDHLLGAGSVLASRDFAARFCTRDARGRLHFAAPPPLPPCAAEEAAAAASRRRREASPGAASAADCDPHSVAPTSADSESNGDGAAVAPGDSSKGAVPMVWRRRPRSERGGRRGGLGHGEVARGGSGGGGGGAAAAGPRLALQVEESCAGGEMEAVVLGLRFFSPAEVAAIHGMPSDWSERASAAGLSLRQQYGLLGNGLSVDVAAYLLRYLLNAQPAAPRQDLRDAGEVGDWVAKQG